MYRRLPAAAIVVVAFLVGAQSAEAQREPLAAETDLKAFLSFENRLPFSAMVNGERQPAGEKDRQLAELGAKYYVFSNTLKTMQLEPGALHNRRTREFANNTISYLLHPDNVNKNAAFRKMFTKELIKAFRRVFALKYEGNHVSMVNTGLMLPIFAKLKDQEAANFFAEVVKKKENRDVVKLFAFQALQVHYTKNAPKVDAFEDNKIRQHYANQIDPVIEYVLATPPNLKMMSDEEKDAYRYVRCEAIKVLAKTKIAWIPLLPPPGVKKPPKMFAPVAYALLRVLAEGKDGITPPPTLSERLVAAKGLCNINAKHQYVETQKPYYNPDLAVKPIFNVVIEFTVVYDKDREVFNRKENKLPAQLPWKSAGEELRTALKTWVYNLPAGSKAEGYAKQIVTQADPIFNQTKMLQDVEDPFGLRNILRGIPAPNPVVYRDFDYKVVVK